MDDRLVRSRSDRVLAGVAGGLADRFDLDPSLVRIGWVILALASVGTFVLIYIVMAIVVPEEPAGAGGWSPAGPPPSSAASSAPAWSSTWPDPSGVGAAAPAPGGPPADPEPGRREARRAARDARRAARRSGSGGPGTGGIVAGVALVALGAYLLVREFAPQLIVDLNRLWPAALIVLGIVLVSLSIRRTPGEPPP